MKQYFSVFTHQHIALNIFLFLTMLSLILPIASTAGNETNTADELISLAVKDEPLRDVFKKVSMATGYEISLCPSINRRFSGVIASTPKRKRSFPGAFSKIGCSGADFLLYRRYLEALIHCASMLMLQ